MSVLDRLRPLVSSERLYPSDVAFMARTELAQIRMTGFGPRVLDTVTTSLMGLFGERSAVRHRSGVTDEILALLERAGLDVVEDIRAYETAEEAERHADQLIEEGRRFVWPYPLREGRFPDHAHLVPPELWRRLNAKESLAEIVPSEWLAPREIRSLEDMARREFERPVFLKAGGDAATGGGYAVRHCPDQAAWADAVEWFQSLGGIDRLIVEDDVAHLTCWCVAILVEPSQTICIGAAEQTFSEPGRQSGSIVDPATPLPPEGAEIAVAVGESARRQGYLGLAGVDIGVAQDGRLVVFDPNFRFNASTSQVMLHGAAAKRGGHTASCSVNESTPLSFEAMKGMLVGPIDDGWFVPTRLVDSRWLPTTEGKCMCTGFVLGADRAEAVARQAALKTMLEV